MYQKQVIQTLQLSFQILLFQKKHSTSKAS
jgi:hypothetical protein